MQSAMNAVPGFDRSTSAPVLSGGPSTPATRPLPFMPTATSAAPSAATSPKVPHASTTGIGTSKAKGMQLGAGKVPAGIAAASLAVQLEEEAAAEEGIDGNPWGTDDLIDINADEDDWSK